MIFKDYYKILGLESPKATIDDIKTAYREQAKKYHPDVNVGNKNAEERFKDINEAYKTLTNQATKRKYDRMWLEDNNLLYMIISITIVLIISIFNITHNTKKRK